MTSLRPEAALDTTCVDQSARPWVSTGRGSWLQLLRVARASGTWSLRNRFEPGFTAPTHRHTGEVHAFTVSGRWRYAEHDFEAGPGSYVHEQAGAVHTLAVPEDNTGLVEVAFVVEGGLVFQDAEGNYVGLKDGRTMLAEYLDLCAQQGHAVPQDVLS